MKPIGTTPLGKRQFFANARSLSMLLGAGGSSSGGSGSALPPGACWLWCEDTGNTFGGAGACANLTLPGGNYNTVLGFGGMTYNSTGDYNTCVGAYAGEGVAGQSYSYNTFVGYECAEQVTSGSYNSFLGYQAGEQVSTGTGNCCMGYLAGQALGAAAGCTFIGREAGSGATDTVFSTAVGISSGVVDAGGYNSALGAYSMCDTDTGTYNVAVGYECLEQNEGGSFNACVGAYAGEGVNGNSFSNSVLVGYEAGHGTSTGGSNVKVGYQAGYTGTTAQYATYGGYQAGYSETTGNNYNAAWGYQALYHNQAGQYNVCVGAYAGEGAAGNSCTANTLVGYQAGHAITTGAWNVKIGHNAGFSGTTASHAVYVGHAAGVSETTGNNYNTAVGYFALFHNQTGQYNVCVGAYAGEGVLNNSHSNNTFVGYESGHGVTTGGSNAGLGYQSLHDITSGAENCALGLGAGGSITTQDGGVFLGYQAGANCVTADRLYIENSNSATPLIYGEFDNDLVHVYGTFESGTAANYSTFEADGTLEFNGDATVWEDLRVSLERGKLTGANQPAFEQVTDDGGGSNGVYAYNFDNDDEIWFSVQMPHAWKEGSTIYPHLHWCCETDGTGDDVGIGLEYTWANIDATFGNTTIITTDVDGDTALKHLVDNFAGAGISGAGKTISSVLLCRFFRQAAAANDYADGIFALEVDFHYELDTVGSRQITTK